MKKKIFLVLVLVLFPFNCLALVKPTSNFYVNDYADILDNDVEQYIMQRSVDLEKQTDAQIVVVTVKNLEGMSLEEYATKLFRSFGIGDKDKNNGLLLLLALEERQFRVEVGYGLEGVLPDGLTGRYQDQYIIPYLKNNDWNTGVKTGYTAFYKKLCDYYKVEALSDTLTITDYNDDNYNSDDYDGDVTAFAIFNFIFAIVGILQGSHCRQVAHKKHKKLSKTYIIMSVLILVFLLIMVFLNSTSWLWTILIKEIFWLIGRFSSESSGRYYSSGGGWSSGGWSSGGGGGFSGGGGSSGSGGSSRGF